MQIRIFNTFDTFVYHQKNAQHKLESQPKYERRVLIESPFSNSITNSKAISINSLMLENFLIKANQLA